MFVSAPVDQTSGFRRLAHPGKKIVCVCVPMCKGEYFKAKEINFFGSSKFFGGFVYISQTLPYLRCDSLFNP